MKWRILVCVLLAASLAEAASTVTVVTPANTLTQPLQFRVYSEFYGDGTVRFEVFVSPGSSAISPRRDARFVVWGEDLKDAPEKGFGARPVSERPVTLAVSSVREDSLDAGLRYEVQTHRSLVPRVSLTFLNYEPRGMPAFDGYEIMLGQFVTEGR
ncbi:hypothetical protein ACFL2Z_00740 [Candidatus Eisenbacteria bacterium]|uniref:DUF2808 domain-containing protein n=1 Tax=Eiseniibacteriota bacterium TaxID=2212470 RepID=A0ABV6YMX3_UNCEI